MTRFFDKVDWRGCDIPVNYIIYDLTEGGDLVRGKPHTWEALQSHVWREVRRYEDLKHFREDWVRKQVDTWLQVNERKT